MIASFLNFTRVKQVTYIFMIELMACLILALKADSNVEFATKMLNVIYKPIFALSEKYQKILLQECHDLICIFPNMTTAGLVTTATVIVIILLLIAYLLSYVTGIVAKKRGIV